MHGNEVSASQSGENEMTRMTKAEAVANEIARRNITWTPDLQDAIDAELRTCDAKDTACQIVRRVVAK